jgi:hypothetical protein
MFNGLFPSPCRKALKVAMSANFRAHCVTRWPAFHLIFESIFNRSFIPIKNEKDILCNPFPSSIKKTKNVPLKRKSMCHDMIILCAS